MLSPEQACTRVADIVKAATAAGATAADASYSCDESLEVQVRLGQLEDVGRSEGQSIGLRVFIGQQSASISTSDTDPARFAELAERAIAMARATPADPYAGLAPEELLLPAGDWTAQEAALDGDDGGLADPAELRELALAAEDAARAQPGISNSEGGSATSGRSVSALATSHGFCRARSATGHSLSVSVLAGDDTGQQRDHDGRAARHRSDLPDPQAVGRLAAERALARRNPGKMPSGAMPVIFDPRVAPSMISHLLGAINGGAIARRTSFLLGKDGDRIFDSAITILDDPHRWRGMRSRLFDGEGLPTAPRKLIDAGHLTGWLMDSAAARQLGLQPTGHAGSGGGVSASNVAILPGRASPAALMADIRQGVYITELAGQGINMVTGDYSRGASGFRIVDGELAEPVAEFTIAGHLLDMFSAMHAADDLDVGPRVVMERALASPTLRIDSMVVAGD